MKERLERLKVFIKEVRLEMSKVTWPTRAEIKDATVVVIISVVVIAAFIGVIDWVLYSLVKVIL
ncbi:MAG: preprotein translocase subunit SecE [Candidatus Eiseniibacteriota bacterium]|nr:MAG: preprotein translocase subunit SecE [Candidatus Eisenbacteria bacterium]